MASNVLTIDPHISKISFSVKKLGFLTISGTMADFTGEVSFPKEDLADANFNVCVSPSTIDTGTAKRDEHLKSKDFFFVNEYPKICFQSTYVNSDAGGYKAIGDLTILGVTREVSIPFIFSDDFFVGQFAVNRSDFKLGEKFPAFIVGKTIQITIKCKIT